VRAKHAKRATRSKKPTRPTRSTRSTTTKPARSIQLKPSPRAKKPMPATDAWRLPWATSTAGTVVIVMCVVGALVLLAAPQPYEPEVVATLDAPLAATATTQPKKVAVWPRSETNTAATPSKPLQTTFEPETTVPNIPITHVTPAAAVESVATPASAWPLLGPTEKVDVQTSAVTITGCLDLDDEGFRLKDTAGVDAPKSRSWKSGFLTKRTAPIELLDADNSVKLSTYVGHRVAATGTLVDREMQVRSVRRVTTGSCN